MALPAPAPGSACLVTGASAGIGAELARELARRGHNLLLVARREDRLRALAEELERDHHVRAVVEVCDLGDTEGRERLIERVEAHGPQVETLVNNAGFTGVGDVHSHPADQLGMVKVNVEALVALTATFLPAMVERRRGAIINVASLAAFQPLPTQATYAATKAFVLSFSEATWAEARRSGVTVTALCPGPVASEFWGEVNLRRGLQSLPLVWSSAADVARAGIAGAERGRRVVVPGLGQRAAAAVSRHGPHPLLLGPFATAWRWAVGA